MNSLIIVKLTQLNELLVNRKIQERIFNIDKRLKLNYLKNFILKTR